MHSCTPHCRRPCLPRPVRARRADRGILSRSLEATFSASGVRRRTPCPLCSEVVCARCSSIGDVRSSSLSPSRWRCQALPRRLRRRRVLSFRPCSSRQAPPVRGWTGCVRISRRRCRATTPPRAGSQRPGPRSPRTAPASSRSISRSEMGRLGSRGALRSSTAPALRACSTRCSAHRLSRSFSSRMYVFSKLAEAGLGAARRAQGPARRGHRVARGPSES